MSETLHTCPDCGQTNFTAKGLKAHQGGKTCVKRAALVTTEHGVATLNEDAVKGAQLTTQYHRATGGMKEVVIFGAMMMQLREEHPEMTQKGGDRRSNSTREVTSLSLKKWLATYAPEVKEATAYRFLHVTESIAEKYVEIVGAKVAKAMPLSQLVTAQAEELPKGFEAKQLELFEFVNGTSQRSWLDMFSPESPQKRGAKSRKPEAPRPLTTEEMAQLAEDEYVDWMNRLDGWFLAAHHTRVKKDSRLTAIAVLEEAISKLRAVK